MEITHACYPTEQGWKCEVCNFIGSLKEAIKHIVEHQFRVDVS